LELYSDDCDDIQGYIDLVATLSLKSDEDNVDQVGG